MDIEKTFSLSTFDIAAKRRKTHTKYIYIPKYHTVMGRKNMSLEFYEAVKDRNGTLP